MTGTEFEDTLDHLQHYLAGYNNANAGLQPKDVQWILGDIGMGAPTNLPFGFIAPMNDTNQLSLASGLDMDVYTVPILIVHAQHDYTNPTANANGFEQEGYRDLMRLAQNIRQALRHNITLDGAIATSKVNELRPVLVNIDNKLYRAVRLTWEVRQRRGR